MNEMKEKIIFMGGTKRAVLLYKMLINRNDIEISYSIFMNGYEDEHVYCEELVNLAKTKGLNYVVSDIITYDIIKMSKEINPLYIIGGGIWRTFIPKEFLNIGRYKFIGLHGSGLPSYRGWAGINWYIINDEKEYKMRFLQLNPEYDAGPLIARLNGQILEYKLDLQNEKHLSELFEDIYRIHVNASIELLELILKNEIKFIPQNETEATYTCHRGPNDGEIDWNNKTKDIFNFIRAQSKPYQGAYTYFKGKKIKIWRAKPRYDLENYIGRIEGKVIERNLEKKTVSILTKDSGIEILEAENSEGETNLLKLFSSVRDRCKSKVEAYMDFIGFE